MLIKLAIIIARIALEALPAPRNAPPKEKSKIIIGELIN